MKIKRFFAPDIRQAMRMVKDELGADAVIMSNRSCNNGVEIVAAMDFDEQLIHQHAGKVNIKSPTTESLSKKNASLPTFQNEANTSQILSSKRKRQVDGTVMPLPARRKIDHHIGYAEKVALNSAKRESMVKKSGQSGLTKSAESGTIKQLPDVLNAAEQPQAVNDKLLLEMRQELSYLRNTLDKKLPEIRTPPSGQSVRLELLRKFHEMGITKTVAGKIANRLGSHSDIDLAWRKSLEMLATFLPLAEDNLMQTGGIVALVGPTGVGKTTTVAKLAAKYILQHGHGQVALITTDNFRIAAHEQLKIYGNVLDIPVGVAANSHELRELINRFSNKSLILIDTAGVSQRNMHLTEQINILQQSDISIKSYLVMSATTQFSAMNEIIDAFQVFKPEAGILTKLDESAMKGPAVSALAEHQLPLSFITDGQMVPEDIHDADAHTMIQYCHSEIADDMNQYDYNKENWVATGYA